MSARLHLERAESYETWAAVGSNALYPEWIDGEWRDVTDSLMALYHYVLAFAPRWSTDNA